MKRADHIQGFVQEIWAWYPFHKRKLPWRDLQISDPTERAYQILVSEVMLQQTQVPRVIGAFRTFLERFPRLQDLANADNKEVLMNWRGMGYNSRALRLRDAARVIANCELRIAENSESAIRNPQFPTSMADLMSIPGIGHYTAAAIRNFAFGIPTPCLDTNIRRVLHRTFIGPENSDGTWKKDDTYLLALAGEVLEEAMRQKRIQRSQRFQGNTSLESLDSLESLESSVTADWHAALMDFGSLVCTKRSPKWELCPLTRAGISKSTRKNFELRNPQSKIRNPKSEPGRMVGSTFIPNRIFRGRIVDALRDAPKGLRLSELGPKIAIDWEGKLHRKWLDGLLEKLVTDRMLRRTNGKFVLG